MLNSCHGNTISTFLQLQIPTLPAQLPDPNPATSQPRCPDSTALAETRVSITRSLCLCFSPQALGAQTPLQLPARSPRPQGAEPAAAPQGRTSQSISRDFKGKRCLEPALSHAHPGAQDHPLLPVPLKGRRAAP